MFDATLSGDDKYLDKEFENAKSLCSNNAQKGVVKASRAEFHLSQGLVELTAKYVAQCLHSQGLVELAAKYVVQRSHALMTITDTTLRLSLQAFNDYTYFVS